MQLATSAAIIGALPAVAGQPAAGPYRLARLADVERLFAAPDVDPYRSPTLVAAALALMEGVPRVLVAPRVALVTADAPRVIAIPGPLDRAARDALAADDGHAIVLDLASNDPTPDEVRAARARNVRFAHPTGAAMIPGQRRAIAVGGAALALPLLFGTATLSALVDLATLTPLAPLALDPALVDAGVLVLVTRRAPRSGPRVALPPGETPLAPKPTPTADDPAASGSGHGPTARLERELAALAQRHAHRFGRDRGAIATLEREAKRLLQAEVAAGAIKTYGLLIAPSGDTDLAIEVAVTLPKRVGKVIIRVTQT